MYKLIIPLLLMNLYSCSKEKNDCIEGYYKLDKIVDNQKHTVYKYPDDSCYHYSITNGYADIYLYNGIKDSFLYKREVNCNYVFFNNDSTFQYGYLWKYNLFIKL